MTKASILVWCKAWTARPHLPWRGGSPQPEAVRRDREEPGPAPLMRSAYIGVEHIHRLSACTHRAVKAPRACGTPHLGQKGSVAPFPHGRQPDGASVPAGRPSPGGPSATGLGAAPAPQPAAGAGDGARPHVDTGTPPRRRTHTNDPNAVYIPGAWVSRACSSGQCDWRRRTWREGSRSG